MQGTIASSIWQVWIISKKVVYAEIITKSLVLYKIFLCVTVNLISCVI